MTGSGASPESRTSGFPAFLDSGLAASRRPSMTAEAPVVANRGGIRALCMMRWGMPSSQKAQLDAAGRRACKLRAKGNPVVDAFVNKQFATRRGNFVKAPPQ
jgi:hypothetical protein